MAAKKESLNRNKFLAEVASRTGAHRRDVEHVWEHAVATIKDAVREGRDVSITGFGKFRQRVRAAQKAGMRKNPFTGEMVKSPARPELRIPRFAPAKQFKEFVGGKGKPTKPVTKPMALAGATSAPAPKKAAAKKPAAKKSAAKKPAKKAAKKKR